MRIGLREGHRRYRRTHAEEEGTDRSERNSLVGRPHCAILTPRGGQRQRFGCIPFTNSSVIRRHWVGHGDDVPLVNSAPKERTPEVIRAGASVTVCGDIRAALVPFAT